MGDKHEKQPKDEKAPEGAEKATTKHDADDDTPDVEGHRRKGSWRGDKNTMRG